jgi:hypothetical protein
MLVVLTNRHEHTVTYFYSRSNIVCLTGLLIILTDCLIEARAENRCITSILRRHHREVYLHNRQ